jgi:hypothetical protein
VNKKGLPVWKLADSFSVYIILPENTHQYLFTAADNSPWNFSTRDLRFSDDIFENWN